MKDFEPQLKATVRRRRVSLLVVAELVLASLLLPGNWMPLPVVEPSVAVSASSVVPAVALGNGFFVGLRFDGTVAAIGYNEYGQCDVGGWAGIVRIATNGWHTVGLRSDGTVVAVGDNSDEQCDVDSWTDIHQVATSWNHTVGLRSDGMVVAVGRNDDGQCDVESWIGIIGIAAGECHTVGLRSDGTVVAVGDNSDEQCDVDSWTDIHQVAAGHHHTVGLKADGTVVAVGRNDDGQCDVESWTGIIGIAAGEWHTVGLRSDSTVVAAGDRWSSGQYDIGGWSDIVQVAAGEEGGTMGLRSDGTILLASGKHHLIPGSCDVGGWAGIAQVSAGAYHTVGLKSDGTVVAVGSNSYGECDVESWTSIQQVAVAGLQTVLLKSDGTVVAVGWNDYGQCDVGSWTSVQQVAAGELHTVGLMSDGAVVAVGDDTYGRCDVASWTDIRQVSAGGYHTVGLESDGTVVAVGGDSYEQCDVESWTDIEQVSAGVYHTVGLRSDGTVVAVGRNDDGQCDVESWTDIEQVSAGLQHTLGLKSDGTVVTAGVTDYGLGDVVSWTGIQQLSAGYSHTVGLKSDGTVVAAGLETELAKWNLLGLGQPDLVIVALSWSPACPQEGDKVTFSYTEKNQRSVDGGDSGCALYIDGDRVETSALRPLPASESADGQFSYEWIATAGEHSIKVEADWSHLVSESNETNNALVKTLVVLDLSEIEDFYRSIEEGVNQALEQDLASVSSVLAAAEFLSIEEKVKELKETVGIDELQGKLEEYLQAGFSAGIEELADRVKEKAREQFGGYFEQAGAELGDYMKIAAKPVAKSAVDLLKLGAERFAYDGYVALRAPQIESALRGQLGLTTTGSPIGIEIPAETASFVNCLSPNDQSALRELLNLMAEQFDGTSKPLLDGDWQLNPPLDWYEEDCKQAYDEYFVAHLREIGIHTVTNLLSSYAPNPATNAMGWIADFAWSGYFSQFDQLRGFAATEKDTASEIFTRRLAIYQSVKILLEDGLTDVDSFSDVYAEVIESRQKAIAGLGSYPAGSLVESADAGTIAGILREDVMHGQYEVARLNALCIKARECRQYQAWLCNISYLDNPQERTLCNLTTLIDGTIEILKPNLAIVRKSTGLFDREIWITNNEQARLTVTVAKSMALTNLGYEVVSQTLLSGESKYFLTASVADCLVVYSGCCPYHFGLVGLDDVLQWSGTIIELSEPGSKLYLHVYDKEGNHVGVDYENNSVDLGISGGLYFDAWSGTTTVYLPADIHKFDIVVDSAYAEQQVEDYTLTVSSRSGSQIVDSSSGTDTIEKGKRQEYTVTVSAETGDVSLHQKGGQGLPTWIWILVGVGALLVMGLGAYFVRRRVAKQQ